MKKFSTTLKYDMVEAIKQAIEILLQTKPIDDETKYLFCSLHEIRSILYKRLDKQQGEFKISFTPAQAFALRIMAIEYVYDVRTQLGNKMHAIANQVHKHYS
jgi:hypothetical protein